jgi:hypothetical protein
VTLAINTGKARKWSGEMRSHDRNHRRDETRTVRPARRARRSQPATQRYLEGLQPPEIVGEVANPGLEAIRRFWWRAFDRVCNCVVLIRLLIHNRTYGPEPPTPVDLQREADHERLVRAFPVAGEAIVPTKYAAGQNRDGDLGSPYS